MTRNAHKAPTNGWHFRCVRPIRFAANKARSGGDVSSQKIGADPRTFVCNRLSSRSRPRPKAACSCKQNPAKTLNPESQKKRTVRSPLYQKQSARYEALLLEPLLLRSKPGRRRCSELWRCTWSRVAHGCEPPHCSCLVSSNVSFSYPARKIQGQEEKTAGEKSRKQERALRKSFNKYQKSDGS